MSGYAFIIGSCIGCGNVFTFNPHRVPSVIVKGTREPICRACVDRANPTRIANGLDPIVVHADSYEPIPAEEL
jgi:Fe-S-cluster-containing dehydrogenase component